MNNEKKAIIEQDLSFALSLFQETPNKFKSEYYISDYTIKFCLKHNLSIDETLEVVNNVLSDKKQVKKEWVVPKSKQRKAFTVKSTLFDLISDNCALYSNEEKRQTIISDFCKLTGMDSEFVTPIIKSRIQFEKKKLIETELYNAIMKNSNNSKKHLFRKEIKDLVIDFSEAIETTPEYTLGVLTRKIRAEQKKSLPDSQGDSDGR